ncbi:MAG: hypothetical protein ACRBBP_11735, partial [Bdellovibrionales bacterium]
VIFDTRIQRRLIESRAKQLQLAREQLIQIREDIVDYLEASLIHQVNLFTDQLPEVASTLHLLDIEVVNKYIFTLKEIKEQTLLQSDLYPKLHVTIDELLSEIEY